MSVSSSFKGVVHLTEAEYAQLLSNGSITSGTETLTYDRGTLYVTDNSTEIKTYSVYTQVPSASSSNVGQTMYYVGTDGYYDYGCFYCVKQLVTGSYAWQKVNQTSEIKEGDLVENIYVNNDIKESDVDTFLASLTYDQAIDMPGGIYIANSIKYFFTCTLKASNNTEILKPLACAVDMATLGTFLGISGASGYAIVAFYGSKLIYLSVLSTENQAVLSAFGLSASAKGFQGISHFNIMDLFCTTYQITPDKKNYDYQCQITYVMPHSIVAKLFSNIPFSFYHAENASKKVTSISASSTDDEYPSAKCVYDIVGNIETLLSQI